MGEVYMRTKTQLGFLRPTIINEEINVFKKEGTMPMFKKSLIIVIAILIIISGNQIVFANSGPTVMENVEIFINGNQFKTDKEIYNLGGTIMVPMKAALEAFGDDMGWIGQTKTARGTFGDESMELSISNDKMRIHKGVKTTWMEPYLIQNDAYVPLRFIAELLVYEVNWDSESRIINMDNTEIKAVEKLKTYKSSSEFKDDYIKIEIVNNEKLHVKGQSALNKEKWLLEIKDEKNETVMKEYKNVKTGGLYKDDFYIKDKLNSGEYKLNIYFKAPSDKLYWSYYWDIPFRYENSDMFFPISPVYVNNRRQRNKNNVLEPENFLDITIADKSEKIEIEGLAKEITKDADSDYDKLLRINDWVAQNIYYDWDAYLEKSYGRTDAYGTYKSKKSVCQGYAELTNALLRSIGIPARIVTGHALGVSANNRYWDRVNHEGTNHAWNEAFVDGRWIILDTTWNSGNKFENGEFIKGNMRYRYFDPNLETFSYTHKIMGI